MGKRIESLLKTAFERKLISIKCDSSRHDVIAAPNWRNPRYFSVSQRFQPYIQRKNRRRNLAVSDRFRWRCNITARTPRSIWGGSNAEVTMKSHLVLRRVRGCLSDNSLINTGFPSLYHYSSFIHFVLSPVSIKRKPDRIAARVTCARNKGAIGTAN